MKQYLSVILFWFYYIKYFNCVYLHFAIQSCRYLWSTSLSFPLLLLWICDSGYMNIYSVECLIFISSIHDSNIYIPSYLAWKGGTKLKWNCGIHNFLNSLARCKIAVQVGNRLHEMYFLATSWVIYKIFLIIFIFT